jgi:uncharacterized protein YdhG (YjbR/CyaY superfamily)
VVEDVPEAATWATSKGTLQFTPDDPLPDEVVRRLIEVRRAQAKV